ncbi:MAG: TonB-dependent receptor, partial [Planctomycetes bacterium]|nr:TonB-dependent receptor [Planctomycetota bacterium]
DGEGDRIPPDPHDQGGTADTRSSNLSLRVARDTKPLDWKLGLSYYSSEQDTRFSKMPGQPHAIKTGTQEGGIQGENPDSRNILLDTALSLHQIPVPLELRCFYRDFHQRFTYYPYFPGGGQDHIQSRKFGAKLLSHAKSDRGLLQWGVDYSGEKTSQILEDGRSWVPELTQTGISPFLQGEYFPSRKWSLTASLRREFTQLEMEDHTLLFSGATLGGGKLDYQGTPFQLGCRYGEGPAQLFANFSRSFGLSDVGYQIRGTQAATLAQADPRALRNDRREVGLDYRGSSVRGSLVGFVDESKTGVNYGPPPLLAMTFNPEKIQGLEMSFEWEMLPRWSWGGTYSYCEGRRDTSGDGLPDAYLPGYRIPPVKWTLHLENRTTDDWSNYLQVFHSGNRDRFPGSTAFSEGRVDSYFLLDFLSRVNCRRGTFSLGVENLLDKQYFSPISQWFNYGPLYSAARGRSVRLSWLLDW